MLYGKEQLPSKNFLGGFQIKNAALKSFSILEMAVKPPLSFVKDTAFPMYGTVNRSSLLGMYYVSSLGKFHTFLSKNLLTLFQLASQKTISFSIVQPYWHFWSLFKVNLILVVYFLILLDFWVGYIFNSKCDQSSQFLTKLKFYTNSSLTLQHATCKIFSAHSSIKKKQNYAMTKLYKTTLKGKENLSLYVR